MIPRPAVPDKCSGCADKDLNSGDFFQKKTPECLISGTLPVLNLRKN
jgi:hypothetical protein